MNAITYNKHRALPYSLTVSQWAVFNPDSSLVLGLKLAAMYISILLLLGLAIA